MKNNNWEKSLNIKKRFDWATPEQRKHILIEIKFQRNQQKQEIINLIKKL